MNEEFKLRPLQDEKSDELVQVMRDKRVAILSGEVRSGKTLTALAMADKLKSRKVLFITKKKAITDIQNWFDIAQFNFELVIINYESVHKVDHKGVDLIICDESHSMGAFPKPSNRTKIIRSISQHLKCNVLLMSGTLTPESYSQIFHQLWISFFTPFEELSFYKWANVYVDKYEMTINSMKVTRYERANEKMVRKKINPLMVTMTQKEAGFKSKVTEHFIHCEMSPMTYKLTKQLKKDLVIEGASGVILADTSVKLQQKLHQLYSGTVKLECGKRIVIDTTKAEVIKNKFRNQKIGIFYKFKAELDMIKQIYGDEITEDLEEFNNSDKSIALQVVSGREGINLSKAKYLVFINIDFSAVSYFQAKDRLTVKERPNNDVYWIFSVGGIEQKIYESVAKKQDFTNRHFKKFLQENNDSH